jgi:hypothetical protein
MGEEEAKGSGVVVEVIVIFVVNTVNGESQVKL